MQGLADKDVAVRKAACTALSALILFADEINASKAFEGAEKCDGLPAARVLGRAVAHVLKLGEKERESIPKKARSEDTEGEGRARTRSDARPKSRLSQARTVKGAWAVLWVRGRPLLGMSHATFRRLHLEMESEAPLPSMLSYAPPPRSFSMASL